MRCLNYWLIQNSFKSILPKGRENGDQRCSWLRLFLAPINCAWDLSAPWIGNLGRRHPVFDSSRVHRQPRCHRWHLLIVADQCERRWKHPIRDLRAWQVLNIAVKIEQSKAVKAKAKAKANDELEFAMINFKVM
ncbi:hypothetical protein PIB30_002465 [Stylosanthes scabra]|uniref:Uncharacterized protein n=1 Tax=Stylosanthes scabra TaxID=79078 RepID=A0ABU6X0J6_9FABA|nr:hypothetical protein [Stylosanthes scabra]